MSGTTFDSFVRNNFNEIFKRCDKKSKDVHIWLQDGEKCQNSKAAKDTMEEVEANVIQKIPPRSPDINPIENVFNIVKKELKEQAINRNIEVESKEQLQDCILSTLLSFSHDIIDHTIESMEKRMVMIKQGGGNRLKY